MSFLSVRPSHQPLDPRLDEQLHQYPHHAGNECRTEAEHRKDNSVKPCFDAVKSRNEGPHLTFKPSKTSGYFLRPTGYFHFSPLNRTLRSYWSMIPLYQRPCNNQDRPPALPVPRNGPKVRRAESPPLAERESILPGGAAHPELSRRVEWGSLHCQSVTPSPTPHTPLTPVIPRPREESKAYLSPNSSLPANHAPLSGSCQFLHKC